ncbi:MAG TPA: hypothetical protein VGJ20_30845 [Xanthobacteraceae bacterium]
MGTKFVIETLTRGDQHWARHGDIITGEDEAEAERVRKAYSSITLVRHRALTSREIQQPFPAWRSAPRLDRSSPSTARALLTTSSAMPMRSRYLPPSGSIAS